MRRRICRRRTCRKNDVPLVSELAVDEIPVRVTCRVLKLARQPYYRWLTHPVGDRELADTYVANAVFDAHRGDPEFGYRLLADEVRAGGHRLRPDGMADLCRQPVVVGVREEARREREEARASGSRRPGRAPVHGGSGEPAAADRHHRAPDGSWPAYLCAIEDVWSNRIVGRSISNRMRSVSLMPAA